MRVIGGQKPTFTREKYSIREKAFSCKIASFYGVNWNIFLLQQTYRYLQQSTQKKVTQTTKSNVSLGLFYTINI